MSIISIAQPAIEEDDIQAVTDCLKKGYVSSRAPIVKEFEKKFAEYHGVSYASSCNSGTSALFLALKSLGIGPGDEVIVPNYCFIACANAVKHVGATPVFVDAEINTCNIDTNLIEEKITRKTIAIMAVHTYGHPCDMDKIMEIAQRHELTVIEDACEALGAEYKGRKCGTIGDVGCFSFFPNKTMTTGEGGMVITNNINIYNDIQSFKDQCNLPKRYIHSGVGYNLTMGAMAAALGISQLSKADRFVQIKRDITKRYNEAIQGAKEEVYAKSSCWMYWTREEIKTSDLFETRPAFVPMHLQPPYRHAGNYPISELLMQQVTCLPCGTTLTKEEQEIIIKDICNK